MGLSVTPVALDEDVADDEATVVLLLEEDCELMGVADEEGL